IGTRLVIKTDEMNQVKFVTTAGSYLAANDKRLLFGLNHYVSVDKASIYWPSGTTDNFTNLQINRYYRIKEGGSISAIHY
ncbi:MAG TPA: ASPIC/UnbV domain-containing protein, partial [Candidatus Marinimicrobia bacterium]|nr:ASPIC/UnbV domain-containing protein [Candidatus Neomarinimicrobiota bacterium]